MTSSSSSPSRGTVSATLVLTAVVLAVYYYNAQRAGMFHKATEETAGTAAN
jgi:hypothetical protein